MWTNGQWNKWPIEKIDEMVKYLENVNHAIFMYMYGLRFLNKTSMDQYNQSSNN